MDSSKLHLLEILALMVADMIVFVVAFQGAQLLRFSRMDFQADQIAYILWPLAIILPVNYIFDLYRPGHDISVLQTPGRIFVAALVSLALIILSVYFFGVERFAGDYFGRGILLGTMGIFTLAAFGHRLIFNKLFKKIKAKRNYLVLATPSEYAMLQRESNRFSQKENFEFLPVERAGELSVKMEQTPFIGIIVGDVALEDKDVLTTLMHFRFAGIRIFMFNKFFEDVWHKLPVHGLKEKWFVMENGFILLHNPVGLKVKRVCDIIFSLIFLTLTLPLMLLISLLIKLVDKGPIIYSQVRTGRWGKRFTIYKFRSMKMGAETAGAVWAKKQDSRVTKIGKILRASRLDELPQFWNVLKGEMSFIGPRPERPEFNVQLEQVIPRYGLRHLVKPGITGWAQVLYPYGASVEDALEKLQYDLYYVKNYSLMLDISIVIKTIRVVLFGSPRKTPGRPLGEKIRLSS